MTRVILVSSAMIGLLFIGAPSASATTCQDLVRNCVQKGGTQKVCGADLAQCLKTCRKIGPYSGNTFYATAGCGPKAKKYPAKN